MAETPIGKVRAKLGIDQITMARAMGWEGKQAHLRVSRMENGYHIPSNAEVGRMASILGLTVYDLSRLLALTMRRRARKITS